VLLNELPATNIANPTNNIIAVRDIMDFSTSHNSQFQRTLILIQLILVRLHFKDIYIRLQTGSHVNKLIIDVDHRNYIRLIYDRKLRLLL